MGVSNFGISFSLFSLESLGNVQITSRRETMVVPEPCLKNN